MKEAQSYVLDISLHHFLITTDHAASLLFFSFFPNLLGSVWVILVTNRSHQCVQRGGYCELNRRIRANNDVK